jgi:uncharacterized protein YrzB (UPF0473 family)
MALTREDILDAVRQLQEDDDLLLEAARALLDERVLRKLATRAPDVFDTLRRFILTEELLQLPAEFREFRQQVNERFDRLEGDLAGFKQETRERFDRLEGDLAGFKQETRERFDRLETDLAGFKQETRERFDRLEGDLAGFKQETRERFDRLEGDLAGFKQETRERFDRLEGDLAGFKQETRERFDRVETVQNQLLEDVRDLRNWKEGEKARRDGLDYQRRVIKRAWRTFGGGEGGWPDENPEVAYQIDQWLAAAGIDGNTLDPRSDPQEADLVWWKGRKVAVVEISLKVNGDDVERARLRADTLRQAGLDAIPFVIGLRNGRTPKPQRTLGNWASSGASVVRSRTACANSMLTPHSPAGTIRLLCPRLRPEPCWRGYPVRSCASG